MILPAAIDLPWLRTPLAALLSELRDGTLPHAVLVGGAPGLGQPLLAAALAAAALCTQLTATGACGQCRSCQLLALGTHEDFQSLAPPEDKHSIGIDSVRELCAQLSFSSQRAPRQVGLIGLAEQLTVAATNALLKTLEEPPGGALLVLVSERPRALLATVRSRCRQVLLATPPLPLALDWLTTECRLPPADAAWRLLLNSGAPLAALAESDGEAGAALRLCAGLLAMLRGQVSAAALVRQEKSQLAALRRVLLVLLELTARPLPRSVSERLPRPLPELLGLTARVRSSSLWQIAQLGWRSRQWVGSGVREDLQLLVPLEQLVQSMDAAGA